MTEELLYQIALTQITGIGDNNAKKLLAFCGDAKSVFKTSAAKLNKISGIGTSAIHAIKNNKIAFETAEKEMLYIEKEKISTFFYTDDLYPQKLKHCNDAPILIYGKGNLNFNEYKMVSIVGTRHATDYGKMICENLIAEFVSLGITVVSGLAYGIDISAHKTALKYQLPTIGVLAHGLNTIYPSQHRETAHKMMGKGGIITEFPFKTIADKVNFPKRNRIVAGMSDATIVVESAISGGALITAEIANNYNKDVFAYPGNIDQEFSAGCNKLIKENKANLMRSANDFLDFMGWNNENKKPLIRNIQNSLFLDLSAHENSIFEQFKERKRIQLDELSPLCKLPISTISSALLTMEMKGYLKSLPGKTYEWND